MRWLVFLGDQPVTLYLGCCYAVKPDLQSFYHFFSAEQEAKKQPLKFEEVFKSSSSSSSSSSDDSDSDSDRSDSGDKEANAKSREVSTREELSRIRLSRFKLEK